MKKTIQTISIIALLSLSSGAIYAGDHPDYIKGVPETSRYGTYTRSRTVNYPAS